MKPFVKRQKNDAADAEAICEAASRPTMRFVAVKTREQLELPLAKFNTAWDNPSIRIARQGRQRHDCRSSAIDSTTRTRSACREIGSFW